MTVKLADLVPRRRKQQPGQNSLSSLLGRTMPRVFARDQCKTPKHCCEITICCGRGKQSVSKKLGNPVTGRKNFSVDEATAFGYLGELLHRAGRGYGGASKGCCEDGVDDVVEWTQVMDERLLRDLPVDVAVPVAWWCSMVPYLVRVLDHHDLPPGPFRAATTAFVDLYTLTPDDLYVEVQVLLWQASRGLAYLITPAAREGLEALISEEARSKAAELLEESMKGLSALRSNRSGRRRQLLHPGPNLAPALPSASSSSATAISQASQHAAPSAGPDVPQGALVAEDASSSSTYSSAHDISLMATSPVLDTQPSAAAGPLPMDQDDHASAGAADSFLEGLPVGSQFLPHIHHNPCPQLDGAALTASLPDFLDMPPEAGGDMMGRSGSGSIFDDVSFTDLLHLEPLPTPCMSELSDLSCSFWDLPLDETTSALTWDGLGMDLLSAFQAPQQDDAKVRTQAQANPGWQAASSAAAMSAAPGPLRCFSMPATTSGTKHVPHRSVVISLPHPVPAAATMPPVLRPRIGQISQPLCFPELHLTPGRRQHTGPTVTSGFSPCQDVQASPQGKPVVGSKLSDNGKRRQQSISGNLPAAQSSAACKRVCHNLA